MSGVRVGWAAMLERFAPQQAVELSRAADAAGFAGVLASDPFQPWVPAQGEAAHVWTMLGAIGAATAGTLATGAVTPSFRAHPAVVAQAAATLASLYPGRHWLGLGAGEALNEHIVGGYWPEAPERINRLFEAIDIIGRLFASARTGKDVKFAGEWFRLESTRLWTVPDSPPPIVVSTAGPLTARRAGRVADGLLVAATSPERAAPLLERYLQGARDAGRPPGVRAVRVDLAWAPDEQDAIEAALRNWPNGAMRFPKGDIRSPAEFEQFAKLLRAGDVTGQLTVSSDPDVHRAAIQRLVDVGFTEVYLHNAGTDQAGFLEVFGRDVLPSLRA